MIDLTHSQTINTKTNKLKMNFIRGLHRSSCSINRRFLQLTHPEMLSRMSWRINLFKSAFRCWTHIWFTLRVFPLKELAKNGVARALFCQSIVLLEWATAEMMCILVHLVPIRQHKLMKAHFVNYWIYNYYNYLQLWTQDQARPTSLKNL